MVSNDATKEVSSVEAADVLWSSPKGPRIRLVYICFLHYSRLSLRSVTDIQDVGTNIVYLQLYIFEVTPRHHTAIFQVFEPVAAHC